MEPNGAERLLRETLLAQASASKTPSISAAVTHRDHVLEAAIGLRSLEPPLPATPNTVYGIASITKTLTAIAIMQLVEKGKLSLDDPADKYLPVELRVKGKPVTIEHLLSHTAGIPAPGYAEAQVAATINPRGSSWLPLATPLDVVEFLSRAARHWAVAEPGERFFYLNEGYVALGVIIERVSGLSYSEYIRRMIAEPLRLRSTFASREEAQRHPLLAKPYTALLDGAPRPAPQPWLVWSDGGAYSTAPDLHVVMSTLARGGEPILQRSSVEEMAKPRARLPAQLWGSDSYGLGVTIHEPPGLGRLIGHSGALPGYTGYAGYLDDGAAIALLTNGDLPGRDAAVALLARLRGVDPTSLGLGLQEALERLTGTYTGYQGTVEARVERLGDYLVLESTRPRGLLRTVLVPRKLEPGHAVFETSTRGRRLEVVFTITENGVEMIYERYRLVKKTATEPG